MNERIKELAEQAGSTHKQSLGVYQFYSEELEKFAELIVRECVEVVKQTPRHCAFTTHDLGIVECTINKSAEFIKQQFNLK